MRPEGALADLLSGDAQRIWSGANAVNLLWDRDDLCWLAAHKAAICKATAGVELGGMLRPNAVILDLALQRLDMALKGSCFCGLFAKDMFADPKRLADKGRVDVILRQDDAKTWETHWQVSCRACGKGYAVTQNDGWHFPTFAWVAG